MASTVLAIAVVGLSVQLSAAHEPSQVDQGIEAFTCVGKKLGVLQ